MAVQACDAPVERRLLALREASWRVSLPWVLALKTSLARWALKMSLQALLLFLQRWVLPGPTEVVQRGAIPELLPGTDLVATTSSVLSVQMMVVALATPALPL